MRKLIFSHFFSEFSSRHARRHPRKTYRLSGILVLSAALISSISGSSVAHARWANFRDADIETEVYNKDVEVNSDGTYTETEEYLIKVLKDGGRSRVVSHPVVYNASNSEFQLIAAKTIRDDKEYAVDKKSIEDKPMASNVMGFDQNNQVLIAYPNVEVNSKVYLKYKTKVKEPAISGFYSGIMAYGWGSYWSSSKTHISSELPLFVEVNDPDKVLEVKQTQSGGKYTIDITLKKPIFKQPIDEIDPLFDLKGLPWVAVSTLEKWPDLAKKVVEKYETVLSDPLPELFQQILKKSEKAKTPIEKINTVTSLLSDAVNYMGDWRTVDGAYIPRKLEIIAKTRLGDCKDFAASTAALLRKLGIEAHVAWVTRGEPLYEFPTKLPQLSFNHAIVEAHVPNGADRQTLWIDPTNFVSFAQGIFPDIADRRSLVIDPKMARLEKIPAPGPSEALWSVGKKIQIVNHNLISVIGDIKIGGSNAIAYAGSGLRVSKESTDLSIIRSVGEESKITKWKVMDYNLSSRIVDDLKIKYEFSQKNTLIKTTAGYAYVATPGDLVGRLLMKTEARVSDLYLGMPTRVERQLVFLGGKAAGKGSLGCKIDSPWFSGDRKVFTAKDGTHLIDTMISKKVKITNAELTSKQFAEFQENLQDCLGELGLVYSENSNLTSGPDVKKF